VGFREPGSVSYHQGMLSAAWYAAGTISPLALAWGHTKIFWAQTCAAVGHHPLVILVCAAVPAIERAFILLHGRQMRPGQSALLEILVTLWRILLCAVAVWVACSGQEWRRLSSRVGVMRAWQLAIGQLGLFFSHHLWILLWEILFFLAAFLLLARLLEWLVRVLARRGGWLSEKRHRMAVNSVLRNLIFAPLAVIYLVEMARPVFW
jgi:hypothetical protein